MNGLQTREWSLSYCRSAIKKFVEVQLTTTYATSIFTSEVAFGTAHFVAIFFKNTVISSICCCCCYKLGLFRIHHRLVLLSTFASLAQTCPSIQQSNSILNSPYVYKNKGGGKPTCCNNQDN